MFLLLALPDEFVKRENLWKKIRAMEVFIFRKFLYARIFYNL